MQTGTKISAIAHAALIGWLLFGGSFTSRPLPFEVTEVSLISAEDYAALTAPRPAPELAETPQGITAPEPLAETPEIESQSDAQPEQTAPEPTPQPEAERAPDPAPEPPAPQAEVADTPPVLQQPQEQVIETPDPVSPRPVPRPVDRVAPTPVAPPPPEVKPDEIARPEVTPDEGAATPQETQQETAPEQAADQIVPETAQPPSRAPTSSPRPPTRRPQPPRETVADATPATSAPQEPAEKPAEKPAEQPAPRADTAGAINDVLAEALAGEPAAPATSDAPAGPPLSAGEKESLRVAVSACWNVGSLSSAASATTVVVGVNLLPDGKPDGGSIRLLSSSGGTADAAQDAFGAARRAIIRCGASGFSLPVEKYDQWRNIEMTFNPERMRIK